MVYFFFFKQKTAYEIKECDWSSDVCSSDLLEATTNTTKPTVNKKARPTIPSFENDRNRGVLCRTWPIERSTVKELIVYVVKVGYRIFAILLILVVLHARQASAHRDDYIDETLVYLTLERSELEAEYWFDYGKRSGERSDFYRHNTAFEWGITDSWMVDGRVTAISQGEQGTDFDSARLESRYRFLDEGVLPVDVAASFEVNSERKSDGSTTVGVEPRLILSKDFGEKVDRKSTRLNSSHIPLSRMPSSA